MQAPEKLTIDTPEQIALEFTLATLGSRFLALGIDTLAQVGLLVAIFALLAAVRLAVGPFGEVVAPWLLAIVVLAWFTVYYGYFAFFEWRWNGQTPGKRLIGLRAIHTSGRPMTTYEAILRNLVRVVDQLPGIYAVGILTVFLTERSQRLGDLAADTVVVHEQPVDQMRYVERSAAVPTRHGAAKLTPEEVALVETFLRRRAELFGVRELRARQIAERVRARLGSDDRQDDEAFLEQVAAEYRATGRYN